MSSVTAAGGRAIAGAIDVDHGVGHAHHLAQRRRILPTRHRRLRAQITAAIGQAPAGQLEAGIGAQMIEVVGVLIAAGDGEHAGAQNVVDAVRHQQRITRVGDQRRQPLRDPHTPLGSGQKHHAAIRGEAPAIERSE